MSFLLVFPYLKGFVKPHLAPLTYFLVAVNVLVFLTSYGNFQIADRKLDRFLNDGNFLNNQGTLFAVMIREEPAQFTPMLTKLQKQALLGDHDSRELLGSLALHNTVFMNRAESFDFRGDEIAVRSWKVKFKELRHLQDQHPSYQWGLSEKHRDWVNWLSYQFAHSGFAHLFFNMLFLIFFGTYVEIRLGSSFVILTYLGAGLFGASVFSMLSGISSSPLIGASGAISGLMGLVAFAFWKERLKFFYWLLPVKGYYGFALLPSWLVVIIYAAPDIAGWLAAIPELGSIAYTAHIGGTAFGFVVAMLYRSGYLESENDDDENYRDLSRPDELTKERARGLASFFTPSDDATQDDSTPATKSDNDRMAS